MRCPRCGAEGVDTAGYCVNCRLYRGNGAPAPQSPADPTAQLPAPPQDAPPQAAPPQAAQPQVPQPSVPQVPRPPIVQTSAAQPQVPQPSVPQPQAPQPSVPQVPVAPPFAPQAPGAPQPSAQPGAAPTAQFPTAPPGPPAGRTGQFPVAAPRPQAGPTGQFPVAAPRPQAGPTGQFPAVAPPGPYATGQLPAVAPGQYPPPPARRNPLLIPGIIFGIVCVLLIGAVAVYAVTSGNDDTDTAGQGANPVAASSPSSAPAEPAPADTPSETGAAEPSAGASAKPSASAAPCIVGVWLEQEHTEQVTVINTGTFPFTGDGAYHRYSDNGRVVIDYGDGVHLKGSNGTNQFEYIFAGFISYQYKYDNGMVTYTSARAEGTETFIRNGHTDFNGKLQARVPQPMRVNCGPVAMSLTNGISSIQLKRTSPAP